MEVDFTIILINFIVNSIFAKMNYMRKVCSIVN